jgi:hypothetical protein
MKAQTVRDRADKIEDSLIMISGIDENITRELLDEYAINVWALKYVNDDYPFVQALRLQDICEEIESRLPRVSDKIFNEYVNYLDLLSICMQEIPRRRN